MIRRVPVIPTRPRIWNYQLGGKDNYAVDREASQAANAMVRALGVPDGADSAVESRHLLQRMVDYMLGQGVRHVKRPLPDCGTGGGQRPGPAWRLPEDGRIPCPAS